MLFSFWARFRLTETLLTSIVSCLSGVLIVSSDTVPPDTRNRRNVIVEMDLPVVISAAIALPGIDDHNAAAAVYRHLDVRSPCRVKRPDRPVGRCARRPVIISAHASSA